MAIYFISFFSGVLTVLAPCVLPVLPVILSGGLVDKNPIRPYVITFSLGLSIVLFTLILKASTLFIDIPAAFWSGFSGTILLILGLSFLFPSQWQMLSYKLGMTNLSEGNLQKSSSKGGILGMILIGASLGPVFASCSPTYFVILATVLPASFSQGLINLLLYALGLSLILLLVVILGQSLISNLKWATNPNGYFRKILGLLMLIVGVLIMFGLDKQLQNYLLDKGYMDISTKIEERLLDKYFFEAK